MLLSGGKLTDKVEARFLEILGVERPQDNPRWPLPNAEKSAESSFWGWRSSWTFPAEAWVGQIKVGDEWANLMLYMIDHSSFQGGGFAVLIFRQHQKERVEYWTWRQCVHDFKQQNVGNCLNRYTCSKCGYAYDVDSSG